MKNQFWFYHEIGVFEMQNSGLEEVKNPSEFLLNGRPENASGSVVACSMEGTRPILVEIQALVCQSNFGIPRRTAVGTDFNSCESFDGGSGEEGGSSSCCFGCLCEYCGWHEDDRAGDRSGYLSCYYFQCEGDRESRIL